MLNENHTGTKAMEIPRYLSRLQMIERSKFGTTQTSLYAIKFDFQFEANE
jgi:hypothetical protein